jgi:CheY-like chemotaxis protein
MIGGVVLVIEDYEPARVALAELLTDEGFQVEQLATGCEAIARAEKEPFDVAIVDLQLPDLDGVAVVKSLREHRPEARCIVISGSAVLDSDGPTPRLIDRGAEVIAAGAIAYLPKPLDFNRLLEVLGS